ncbi:type IV toxin-antitoxin system AbiEi family antitoxin domain-containing protein [Lentilactobacillus hilgardii]|uniref:Abortive infection protein AbiGI n=1 Tax=Lentilactobacillus hilgardii TaxID=1588 RepID=A0A6P1E6X6_LENHI|nr:transcriptional regulator [Lentilactobacillus hilgardii]EEI71722.1 hypothetical protein HMPREF0496_1057 [Lentilactobacillus hilgardii ATCC 27305]MCT3390880.1 hypothetical protein [Lentilactobacillus hilgardii]QHB51425.1 hypothetical protein GQR93_03935 [Lentilactobacillus hilgardii]RRG07142.1 MAG: hypothetical protein DUD35_14015 [Lactobacillus sp.]
MTKIENYFSKKQKRLDDLRKKLAQDNLLVATELSDSDLVLAKEMTKEKLLHSIDNRIFITSEFPINDFLIRQLVLGKGIYYGNTALYLWNLSDTFPYTIHIAMPLGYRIPDSRYPDWTKNVHFKQVREPMLSNDVERLDVEGTTKTIQLYSQERLLVDLVKSRPTDQEQIKQSYRRYLHSKDRNFNQLLVVAKRLKVENKVRDIMELMI